MTKYRAWYILNPPDEPEYEIVESPEEGAKWIEKTSKNNNISYNPVFGEAFGLEVFEDGEWCEWYNEYGEDVVQFFDLYGEQKNGHTSKR